MVLTADHIAPIIALVAGIFVNVTNAASARYWHIL
jgi:hypothetical protein